ncbi:MAG TPA: YggT family protein [Sphaerochaeta sp.]|nr:YggT family protein [Sphaerochaeta sp.]
MYFISHPALASSTTGGPFFMTLASVLASLLSFYSLLIWLRLLLSWVKVAETPVGYWLKRIVDPYLEIFKPIAALRRDRFDLTPLAALATLSVVQSLLRLYGTYGTLTVALVAALILQTLWSFLVSPLFWFFIILLIVRLYYTYKASIHTIRYIAMLDSLIGDLMNWVHRTFYPGKAISDRRLVVTTLIATIALYLASSALLRLLVGLIMRIGF